MKIFDMDAFKLGAGLLLLIIANIALGSTEAIIAGKWDKVKFRNGCIRGGIVALAIAAVWVAGWMNPTLLVVEADGQSVNLMSAVVLIMLAAFAAYAVDICRKLRMILTTVTPGKGEHYDGNGTAEESGADHHGMDRGDEGKPDAPADP